MKNEFLSVKDVAVMLGVGKNKSYALMTTEGFPAIRIGGTFKVRADLFDKWVEENLGRTIRIGGDADE